MTETRPTAMTDELFAALVAEHTLEIESAPARTAPLSTLQSRLARHHSQDAALLAVSPFERMQHARDSLNYLDTCGWKRSYHQRLFHEDFLKACTRCFWKHEPQGQFAKDHHKVLQLNSWEHLAQEVLISTPRRFGKTISVSMFAAAMMWAAPSVEISIYSTCKRISQKLLRNCIKFFYEICKQDLGSNGFKVVRQNMEEIVLRGPGGERDVRIVNSYPSKVCLINCKSLQICCAKTGGGSTPHSI